jgi:hypothetical protein
LSIEEPGQLVLLVARMAFQASALRVDIRQFGFQSRSFGPQFMQAPVDVRNRRLGLAQLICGISLRFLGLRDVAAQGFDADLQVLQFLPSWNRQPAANAVDAERRGSKKPVTRMTRSIESRPGLAPIRDRLQRLLGGTLAAVAKQDNLAHERVSMHWD